MPGSGLEIAHTELATQVDGGLVAYGANLQNLYRRGAEYVDRIVTQAKFLMSAIGGKADMVPKLRNVCS